MDMKKIFVLIVLLLTISSQCFAMNFFEPVKIGSIGFPVQAPYHYYVVKGASYNSGKPYLETSPLISERISTYEKGIAVFGTGENALYCDYIYNPNVHENVIKFGGKNNYIISTDSLYKHISKINTNEGLTLYSIVRMSGSERINIIGRQNDGKWVSYVDSRILSDRYFGGEESYKAADGVHYSEPYFQNDTIIIPYKYQLKFEIAAKGEFRFKWDDKAQWFGIEQVVY